MKNKRFALLLTLLLVFALLGSACGTPAEESSAPGTPADSSSQAASAASGDASGQEEPSESELSPLTIEVYSQPANFQGEQVGWMAALLKEKFNVTLSIIAPQVAGADIFAARSASGYLGDMVVLDNVDIQSCISSGLIYDITEEMKSFAAYGDYQSQLDYYNASLSGVEEGAYYAWPCEMANTGATSFTPTLPGVAPTVPWDYYDEIGAPELLTLSDLVSALKAMQEKHPVNEAGDPSFGITLWPDWDGNTIENVNQLTKWYGQEVNGSVMVDVDGNMISLVDDNSAYRKILQFYFEANQAGVVDPDSGTQNWDSVNQKFNSKRAFLIWNDWQQGFWNTTERGNAGENYMMVPISDMEIYQPSDPYYGTGRAFACGTDDPETKERVTMLLDWMSSPEGAEIIHGGIYGFIYEDAEDGNGYVCTAEGESALMDNSPVPEEFGGGLYADGVLQINQWMVAGVSTNPLTGHTFSSTYWPAEVEKAQTTTMNAWAGRFDAEDPVDYLEKNGMIGVVPYVNVNYDADSTDISLIRTSCGPIVCDASWKMIFAKDQAEFDALWEQMKTDIEGFGFDQLVEFDTAKYQALVDERAKALNS